MKLLSRIHSGYLFLFSFLTAFVITPLFQQGLFGDGLMYLTVAFNRYKGYGSFWKQHYSDTSMSFFCEQPPLYFESLGWMYRLFGGNQVAEKFFTLILLALTVFLFIKIWNLLTHGRYIKIAWLPVLFTFCVPVFTWSFCNQVIETMVVPLTLGVFYFQLNYLHSGHTNRRVISFFGIILLLIALLLTKGIQSCFLLVALFFAAVTTDRRRFSKTVMKGLLLFVACVGACGLIFIMNADAMFWLESYFNKRIVATFNHKGATAAYHLEIIVRYFSELLPLMCVGALVSLWQMIGKKYSWSLQWGHFKRNGSALWLMLISLSASMPLAVTLEQRGFYLSPAFPFAVFAFCLLYRRYLLVILGRLARKAPVLLPAAGLAAAAAALVFFMVCKNDYKRDEGMIKDVAAIKTRVKRGSLIGINQSTWNTFSLHSYLNMANNNSLAVTDTLEYFVQEKENKDNIPAGYTRVDISTLDVDLYRKRTDP
jgi:hypothetical protein